MQSHVSQKNSVAWHRLMISGFVLAWIVSVIVTVPANQRVAGGTTESGIVEAIYARRV